MKLIKELDGYVKLREDLNNLKDESVYTVYKATGEHTDKTYYGYTKGEGEQAIRTSFNFSAKKSSSTKDEDRGVQQLVQFNDGDLDGIKFQELEVTDSRGEAHQMRNNFRDEDNQNTVTGPSVLPVELHNASKEQYPQYQEKMHARKMAREKEREEREETEHNSYYNNVIGSHLPGLMRKFKNNPYSTTAGHAHQRGMFDPRSMKRLENNPQAQADLGKLSPEEFTKKYNVRWNIK